MTNRFASFAALTLLLCACSFASPKQEALRIDQPSAASGGITSRQVFTTAMPSGTPELPGHGKEVGLAYGALSGTGGVTANGIGMVHFLEDHSSVVGLQLNVRAADEGFYYEGWLETQNGQRMSVGHLTNPFNDVRHRVRLESDSDLREFAIVRITLEADDGDPEPGKTVAIGTLKQTSR
jgi:hypothetical protein